MAGRTVSRKSSSVATGAHVEVSICIDKDLGIEVTKKLRKGSTVLDLKQLLVRDDPTGQTHEEDFTLAVPADVTRALDDATPISNTLKEFVLSAAPPAEHEELVLPADVVEYRVLQRNLVKKLGQDPATSGAIKLKKKVASTILTTGRTWVGPQGGTWVELDPIVEKPGWLLVEGPGFGTPGPLLRRVEPGEPEPLLLHAVKPGQDLDDEEKETREFVLGQKERVIDAKEWIAIIFGLEPSAVIIVPPGAEDMHGTIEQCGVLKNGDEMVTSGFKTGDRVHFIYTGNLAHTYEGKEPTWRGRISDSSKKAKPLAGGKDYGKLNKHFQLLNLAESTPHSRIKHHYRRLALEYHPDKRPDDPNATQKFQDIKAAYEAIRDHLYL